MLKAWRTNSQLAENRFEDDAYIIPTYIKDLKMQAALKGKISVGKVNVIVHSRGGLYTRGYIEGISPQFPYMDDINSLITLNTPHFGSQLANLVLDKRIIIPKIYLPKLKEDLSLWDRLTLNFIDFEENGPYSIGDIFTGVGSLAVISEHEKKELWGAKNLTVTNDWISKIDKQETDFINKLNFPTNLQNFSEAEIPFHAIATTFEFCDIYPFLCKFDLEIPEFPNYDQFKKVNKIIGRVNLAFTIIKFVSNDLPSELDGFMKYVFNGETNDFIVPNTSMKAGLGDSYITTFPDNIMHVDLIGENPAYTNWSGVTNNEKVNNRILELLKQDFNSNYTELTKGGIPNYKELTYNFLPNFSGFSSKNRANRNKQGKVVIDPESFSTNMFSGELINFDVYQENLDKIIVSYDFPSLNDIFIGEKTSNLSFKNNLSFRIPEEFIGEFSVTVYGFNNGELVSMHTVNSVAQITQNLHLNSIRFAIEQVDIPERSSYRYEVLGMYSDGIERRINELPELSIVINDLNIVKQTDNETIESIIPGNAILMVQIGGLTAELKLTVFENTMLKQTFITDFYATINNHAIDIEWKTLHEFKSKLFTLERSENNDSNFIKIEQKNGKGDFYEKSNYYYYSDLSTNANTIYYRLRLYNVNNNLESSMVIKIDKESLSIDAGLSDKATQDKIVIAPNPLTDLTGNIILNSTITDQQAVLNIYDIRGGLISTKKCAINTGEQKISFEFPSSISNGIYLVQLKTKRYIQTYKLILKR